MRAAIAALFLVPFVAACAPEDPKVEEAREISDRPIAEIVGSDQVRLTRFLSRRGIACPEMYGVAADRAGSEFLLFCADEVTAAMKDDFTHPGWTVRSVFLTTQEVRDGNQTMHCSAVPSMRDVCAKL